MKIAIYGGSFNPIHKGHIEVAKYAIEHLKLDKLIFVPSFRSPFKSNIKVVSGQDRINMINLCLVPKTEVSDFEIKRQGISYTIETISYFKNLYPNDELFLIIGSDHLYKLNKWRNIDQIVEKATIVSFKRGNVDSHLNVKKYNVKLLDNPIFDYASTNFRQGNLENVDLDVRKYIAKNNLYILDFMANMLDAKRHKHSIAVASFAAELAKSLKYDAKKAWLAGAMHDITKCWSEQQHLELLNKHNIEILEKHNLHALTGSIWVSKEYLLEDLEITNAILKHTSLDYELSLLDKIIFVSDKLATGRKWEGIQDVRKLVFENFDLGFAKVVTKIKELIINDGKTLSNKQIEIFNKWSDVIS